MSRLRSVHEGEFVNGVEAAREIAKRFCTRTGNQFTIPGIVACHGYKNLWIWVKATQLGREFEDLRASVDFEAMEQRVLIHKKRMDQAAEVIAKENVRSKTEFLIGITIQELEIMASTLSELGVKTNPSAFDNPNHVTAPLGLTIFQAETLLSRIPEIVSRCVDGDDFLRAKSWLNAKDGLVLKLEMGVRHKRSLAAVPAARQTNRY